MTKQRTDSATAYALECARRHGMDVLGEAWLHAHDRHGFNAARYSHPETIQRTATSFVPKDEVERDPSPARSHVPDSELHARHDPEERLRRSETRRHVSAALASLTPREERVLRMLYGVGPAPFAIDANPSPPQTVTYPGMTLAEASDMMRISKERVRQIEHKALRKCRHPSRSRTLRDLLGDAPTHHVEPLPLSEEPLVRVLIRPSRAGQVHESAGIAAREYLAGHPEIAECAALVPGSSDAERLACVFRNLPAHLAARERRLEARRHEMEAQRIGRRQAEERERRRRQIEDLKALERKILPIVQRHPALSVYLRVDDSGIVPRYTVIAESGRHSSQYGGPFILEGRAHHSSSFDEDKLLRLDGDLAIFAAECGLTPAPSSPGMIDLRSFLDPPPMRRA